MKNVYLVGTIAFLLINTQVFSQSGFDSKWDNGFKVESEDGNFKLKFGGRVMYDFAAFSQADELEDAFGELNNGVEFRRVRFFNSGTVYSNVAYKVQLDFAGGGISFKDVFIEFKGIGDQGKIRVGHFKEPFRLEALTSSKYITFMERSLHSSWSPERNTGIMYHSNDKNKRIFWQFGLFRNGDGAGDDEVANGGINLTARLAGIVMQNEEKKQLLHLGAAISSRNPSSDSFRIRARPEAHLGKRYLNTGTIADVDNSFLFGLEAAFVSGSFSAQAEYVQASVNLMDDSSLSFPVYYAQLSYFLTGESRKYKNGYEGFDRVKPANNAGKDGSGAWEVALRYSRGDLNDGDILGGELSDITVGLNWYLNPVTRIMANYVLADLSDVGSASIIQTRFQIDF